jgi:hypothetical protein
MPEPCPDCGAGIGEWREHAEGCFKLAVEEGRMTPRQRQVALFELQEKLAARMEDVRGILDDQIAQVGANGGRPAKIVMGTNAWRRVATSVPNGHMPTSRLDPNGAKYMGIPVQIDSALPPDELFVMGQTNTGVPTVSESRSPQYFACNSLSLDEVHRRFGYLSSAAGAASGAFGKLNGLMGS